MSYSDTANKILDAAERVARQGGYNAFSFRDIANEVGIKSASVHYHFPTKDALGEALAKRYTERFMNGLGTIDPTDAKAALKKYVDACGVALKEDHLMCLCGMFGAEIQLLPQVVAERTQEFFQHNLSWLEKAYSALGLSAAQSKVSAARLISTVEGAMMLSRSLNDISIFDSVTEGIV